MTLKWPQKSSDSLQMASACFLSFLRFPCFCFQQCPQILTRTSLPSPLTSSFLLRAAASSLQSSITVSAFSQGWAVRQLHEAAEGETLALLWPGCALSGTPSCPGAVYGTLASHVPVLQGDPAHSCLALRSENTESEDHSLIHLGVFC